MRTALAVLRVYKVVFSPLFTGSCRFHPSCSTYMADAIRIHGVVRGGWLGVVRLSRCHPFGSSGYDPVPAHLRGWRRFGGQARGGWRRFGGQARGGWRRSCGQARRD